MLTTLLRIAFTFFTKFLYDGIIEQFCSTIISNHFIDIQPAINIYQFLEGGGVIRVIRLFFGITWICNT